MLLETPHQEIHSWLDILVPTSIAWPQEHIKRMRRLWHQRQPRVDALLLRRLMQRHGHFDRDELVASAVDEVGRDLVGAGSHMMERRNRRQLVFGWHG